MATHEIEGSGLGGQVAEIEIAGGIDEIVIDTHQLPDTIPGTEDQINSPILGKEHFLHGQADQAIRRPAQAIADRALRTAGASDSHWDDLDRYHE